MARANNKYASLNFNDIYEKKITTATTNNKIHPSSPSKTVLSHSRIHGNMLVLSRPSPKPISQPTLPSPQPQPKQSVPVPTPPPPSTSPSPSDQARFERDAISLRPLGRTGTGPIGSPQLSSPIKDKYPLSVSPKSDKFVPPHLRPGFLGREEKPAIPEFQKQFIGGGDGGVRLGNRQGVLNGSPNLYREEGRPKSGGGYERMRRGFEADPLEVNRPGSSGARPSSSG